MKNRVYIYVVSVEIVRSVMKKGWRDRMELLDKYFEIQKEVHNYFGYVEDWRVIPLADYREHLWYLYDDEVIFAEKKVDFLTGNYYKNEIYTQRHLPKWVYRGVEYTMIVVDTHTDGNKFLAIFDNSKELTEEPDMN